MSGMEYFGESARRVIARAVELAQEVGAEELLPEHLLISFEDHESIRQLQMEVRRELVRRRASPAPRLSTRRFWRFLRRPIGLLRVQSKRFI
jgi:hypothetical protein